MMKLTTLMFTALFLPLIACDGDPAAGDGALADVADGADGADVADAAQDTVNGGEDAVTTDTADTADTADAAASDVASPADTTLAVGAICPDDVPGTVRPVGWTAESHCKGVAANYDYLFDDAVVHELHITVAPSEWATAQADLADVLGGSTGGPGGGPPGGGPGGGAPGGASGAAQDPMWFTVEVALDGLTWTHVGMRFKGNSSLSSAYQSGKGKLSFRFNFDKFEDDYPEIDNQRFWGFKKMTFSNAYKDDSLIRDKLAADVFRAGGVPAARGAFTAVTLDVGDGPIYAGLYTMIEDPSDEMIDGAQFEDDAGNLYKPDGMGAAFEASDESLKSFLAGRRSAVTEALQ